MKIAQVAPLIESVPPRLYGGTERIVSYLTEELIRQGHEVTLFASGDSQTHARLIASVPQALRLDPTVKDYGPYAVLQLEHVRQRAHEFDIIHFHSDYLHLPLTRCMDHHGVITTLHGRLDLPDYGLIFEEFNDTPLVSISNHQRKPLQEVNWAGTIYHGLPSNVCTFTENPKEDYVAFLGRIAPEKRPDRAIEIARRAGIRIKIAAKVDDLDRQYFHEKIEPLLSQSHVDYMGEINEDQKSEFLGNARALLFPIDWPEPFGLVMLEAMSCGTPIIAWRAGSVPEVIDDGISGFVIDSIDEAVERLRHINKVDRNQVRAIFEQRFSATRMAAEYVRLYRRILQDKESNPSKFIQRRKLGSTKLFGSRNRLYSQVGQKVSAN